MFYKCISSIVNKHHYKYIEHLNFISIFEINYLKINLMHLIFIHCISINMMRYWSYLFRNDVFLCNFSWDAKVQIKERTDCSSAWYRSQEECDLTHYTRRMMCNPEMDSSSYYCHLTVERNIAGRKAWLKS